MKLTRLPYLALLCLLGISMSAHAQQFTILDLHQKGTSHLPTDPLACQPAPESADSTCGAKAPRPTTISAQTTAVALPCRSTASPRRPSRPGVAGAEWWSTGVDAGLVTLMKSSWSLSPRGDTMRR